jgi:hypothetical protein
MQSSVGRYKLLTYFRCYETITGVSKKAVNDQLQPHQERKSSDKIAPVNSFRHCNLDLLASLDLNVINSVYR